MAAMAVANIALYWICVPYRTQQRFMLQAMGLAATPLARLFDRGRGIRIAAALLLAAHLLTPETWPVTMNEADIPWDLDPIIRNVVLAPLPLIRQVERLRETNELLPAATGLSLVLAVGGCAWLGVWGLLRPGRPGRLRATLVATALAGLLVLSTICSGVIGADPRQRNYPSYPDFLAGWLQLEARSGPSGTRVAYAGTNIPYYLFGTGLRNDVRYVNVDRHPGWLLHDYHREAQEQGKPLWPTSRPGWDRARPDFQAWLENLRFERIALLVVTVVNPGEGEHNIADAELFPIERRWADSRPDLFEPLYGAAEGDRRFRLYRLR
jgi:hypothetical protein